MLEVRGINAVFGTFSLDDISFTARPDDYTVLLGPCGAGKTKLLEIISGVAPHTGGRIFVNDRDITGMAPERRRIGLVYQSGYLFPHLSVRDNIAYGMRYLSLARADKEQRMKWIVDLLNLHSISRRTSTVNLSGGEQQMVILARTLVLQPSLLLMDEPFASLDFSSREELFSVFKILQRDFGMTILHVTHDREEAAVLSDRVLFLWNGRLLHQSSFEELVTSPTSLEVVRFLGLKSIISGEIKYQKFTIDGAEPAGKLAADGRADGHGYLYVPADAVTLSPEETILKNSTSDELFVSGTVRLLLERDEGVMAEIDIGPQILGSLLAPGEARLVGIGDRVRCSLDRCKIVFLEESS